MPGKSPTDQNHAVQYGASASDMFETLDYVFSHASSNRRLGQERDWLGALYDIESAARHSLLQAREKEQERLGGHGDHQEEDYQAGA